jgi:HPt (histidine-containing phosphotransfer) domain-containing protein
VPIVAVTAHDAVHYRERCLAADIDDILSKPYTLEDCRRMLERWAGRGAEQGDDARAAGPSSTPISPDALTCVDMKAVAALQRLGGRHADLYSKLVALFETSSTQALEELEAAVERDDLAAAAAVCHKLASAAANVGALAYGDRVRDLERHALAGEHAAARALCAELCAAHAALLEVLHGQRLRATA